MLLLLFFLHMKTKERLSDEPAKKWRPTLVSAGIALAPDTFQMVLDADSTTKGIIILICLAFDVLALECLWVVVDLAVNKHFTNAYVERHPYRYWHFPPTFTLTSYRSVANMSL